jgi:hypothetical protein
MISAPIDFRITANSNITFWRESELDLNQPKPNWIATPRDKGGRAGVALTQRPVVPADGVRAAPASWARKTERPRRSVVKDNLLAGCGVRAQAQDIGSENMHLFVTEELFPGRHLVVRPLVMVSMIVASELP